MLCRLAVDMGLGSIVRLSWDLISISTATDYLVSLPLQSCIPLAVLPQARSACVTHRGCVTHSSPVGYTGLLHTHPTTRAVYQCCESFFALGHTVSFSCQAIETFWNAFKITQGYHTTCLSWYVSKHLPAMC